MSVQYLQLWYGWTMLTVDNEKVPSAMNKEGDKTHLALNTWFQPGTPL